MQERLEHSYVQLGKVLTLAWHGSWMDSHAKLKLNIEYAYTPSNAKILSTENLKAITHIAQLSKHGNSTFL